MFIRKVCHRLRNFTQGMLILGRDFNAPLNPMLDSSLGSSGLSYRALRSIKWEIVSLAIHDTWRTLYPTVKDFTYYSHARNKYLRLDYFFLSQRDLTHLSKASIESMIISDHNPITLTLSLGRKTRTPKIWRYNPSLFPDTV